MTKPMTHLVKRGYEYTFDPDEQQRRNGADEDVGEDELPAHAPEQPGACERGDAVNSDRRENEDDEVDRPVERDVGWGGKPHQHFERDRDDPQSRNAANDITRRSTLESSSGSPRCRRQSAGR